METCSCKNKRCGCNGDQNERKKQQMDQNSIFRKPTKPKPTKEISKGNLMLLIFIIIKATFILEYYQELIK